MTKLENRYGQKPLTAVSLSKLQPHFHPLARATEAAVTKRTSTHRRRTKTPKLLQQQETLG